VCAPTNPDAPVTTTIAPSSGPASARLQGVGATHITVQRDISGEVRQCRPMLRAVSAWKQCGHVAQPTKRALTHLSGASWRESCFQSVARSTDSLPQGRSTVCIVA